STGRSDQFKSITEIQRSLGDLNRPAMGLQGEIRMLSVTFILLVVTLISSNGPVSAATLWNLQGSVPSEMSQSSLSSCGISTRLIAISPKTCCLLLR
ncbi:unnamed protein product, partial [Allacma fusca]